MKEAIIIQTTTNSEDEAKLLAETLIKKKFAACIHISSNVNSIYYWEGKICNDSEYIVEIKTLYKLKENVKMEIDSILSYDCPQFIVCKISEMSDKYENWFRSACKDG